MKCGDLGGDYLAQVARFYLLADDAVIST